MTAFQRDKFKNIRKIKKITLDLTAKKAGITRVTLWRWENGKNEPSEMQIRGLAKILNINVSEISDLEDEKPVSDAQFSDVINSWLVLADTSEKNLVSQENQIINLIHHRYNELKQTSIVIRGLINSMSSAFYIKDTKLKYITANRIFLDNLSLNKNYSVLGKTDEDLFPVNDAKKNDQQDMEVLISAEAVDGYEDYIPGSRKKKWGLISKLPIFDSENKIAGIVGSFLDITERKKSENRRRILESAIDKIDDYCIWVAKSDSKDRNKNKYLYMNNSIEKMFGIKQKTIMDDASLWLNNVHPDSQKDVEEYINSSEFPGQVSFKYINPETNSLRWFNSTTYRHENELFGVMKDITDEKSALQEKFLLESLLKSAEDFIGIYCLEDNRMIFLNNVIEEITGYSVKDFFKSTDTWDKVVLPEDIDIFKKLFSCDKWTDNLIFRLIGKDCSVHFMSSTSHSHKKIEDKNYHVLIIRDITETKRNQELLEIVQASINQSEYVLSLYNDQKELIYLSESAESLYGYPVDFLKKDSKEGLSYWFDNSFESKYQQEQSKYWETDTFPELFTHEIMTKDGEKKFLESSTFKVNYMDMECRCFIRKDITQRQREENIRRILEDSLNESSRVIWIIATPPSLKTLYVSKSAEKVFGYPAEMYKDNFFLDVCVHPDYRESFREKWTEDSATTGFPNVIRFRIVRPDGEIRWIEHSILKKTPDYFVFVNRDISRYTKMYRRFKKSFKAKIEETKQNSMLHGKIEVARQLKREAVSIEIISKTTGLTLEFIDSI